MLSRRLGTRLKYLLSHSPAGTIRVAYECPDHRLRPVWAGVAVMSSLRCLRLGSDFRELLARGPGVGGFVWFAAELVGIQRVAVIF